MTDHTRAMLLKAWAEIAPSMGDSYRRFTRLLDAEAYLDAAVMLVPEGWMLFHLSGPFANEKSKATVAGGKPIHLASSYAPTPALALLAAIMKAKNDE